MSYIKAGIGLGVMIFTTAFALTTLIRVETEVEKYINRRLNGGLNAEKKDSCAEE